MIETGPRRHSLRPALVPAACTAWLALGLFAAEARADATGWASVNGGASIAVPATVDTSAAAAPADEQLRSQLAFDTGVGTSPAAPIIVGGIFRVAPTLGEYTDFSWSARAATRGFQTGPIGVALDVGMYARAGDTASIGLVGGPILGGPLGLQLAVMGHFGSEEEKGASALLGVDLLRLTMYRESLLDWWPNPSRPDQDVAASR